MATRIAALWQVSVQAGEEAEDALTELLSNLFSTPASAFAATPDRLSRVSVYVPSVSASQKAALREGVQAVARELKVSPVVSVRRIRRENWAESWKRHFKPLEISPRLLVLPSWSKRRPRKGQACVIIDPGLSFGTGQHPTTSFCLTQLANLRTAEPRQSFLDAGCGSGILSIAAAKLGYRPVHAFDFDPDAVRVARENAGLNDVAIRIDRRDLTRLPLASAQQYSVVCANLTYDLLLSERDKLLSRLAPDGTIVLAGILLSQFGAVEKAFRNAGLRRVAQEVTTEWRSAAYRRK